ncbi:MAG TPA: BofC C-terminal domain-containing protein [Firmicutes bacterium]|nr:BofC C-terminal domain-containing protein [Bacillota bacterium]
MRRITKGTWAVWMITAGVLGLTGGYLWGSRQGSQLSQQLSSASEEQPQPEEAAPAVQSEIAITPSTKMVYEYYYPEDGVTERAEEAPAYFLVGLTREDMQLLYPHWELSTFSANEVVLRRTVAGPSHERYIVGIKDGYVAVFYADEQNGVSLKEQTRVPVSSLDPAEQQRLREGIEVVGQEALHEILQDYGS